MDSQKKGRTLHKILKRGNISSGEGIQLPYDTAVI